MTCPLLPQMPGTTDTAMGPRLDPYHGLRYLDQQQLRTIQEDEAAHVELASAPWQPLTQSLLARISELLGPADSSVTYPTTLRDQCVFTVADPQAEYPVTWIAPADCDRGAIVAGELAGARVLLDPNMLAIEQSASSFSIGNFDIVPAGELVVYSSCVDGSEEYTLRLRNPVTGAELVGPSGAAADLVWWSTNSVLFLGRDEVMRAATLKSWNPVTGEVVTIMGEDDASTSLELAVSQDRAWVIVTASGHDSTHAYAYCAGDGGRLTEVVRTGIQPGIHAHLVAEADRVVEYHQDSDGTPFVRDLVRAEQYLRPAGERVMEVHVDAANVYVTTALGPAGRTVLDIWDGCDHLRYDPGAGVDVKVASLAGPEGTILVEHLSWTADTSLHALDPSSGHAYLVEDPAQAQDHPQLRVHTDIYPARDGAGIPVTIVRSGSTPDGAPAVVTAYAAYGVSYRPEYDPGMVALYELGCQLVIVHARGGGERGRAWHAAARGASKALTFHDIIDAITGMRRAGVIDRVALDGASAGGLAMAGVMNLAPGIADAVSLRVPFVDAVATMSDPSLPLTVAEYSEWGDASTQLGLAAIASWSPVDNVRPGTQYPPTWVAVSLTDYRVGFWEGLRLAARLREAHPGNQVLVSIVQAGGHEGDAARSVRVDRLADWCGFIAHQLGLQVREDLPIAA